MTEGAIQLVYQLNWDSPPVPISDALSLQDYTTKLGSFLGNMELTIQDFFNKLGTFVNVGVLQTLGDNVLGTLDFTNGGLVVPVFVGDPSPPQIGQFYYVGGTTDHLRARFASAFDSLAKLGEVFTRQAVGINQAITLGATTTTVNLSPAQPDTSYGVLVTSNWNTTHWVTTKAVGSFLLNWGTAAPASAVADFIVYR